MSFANHNILDIALSIIPPTVVQIRKNLGTKVNRYGQSEAAYSDWIEVYGIVQPGGERNEHIERVDFSRKYVSIWLRGIALDGTNIEWAPDQIRYMGKIFNVISVDDWYPYDNFRKCECVEVNNLAPNQRKLSKPRSQRKSTSLRKNNDPTVDLDSIESPVGKCDPPKIFVPDLLPSNEEKKENEEGSETVVPVKPKKQSKIRF